MDINNDFIRHWTELGDEREGQYLDQFFYYFVAFNCLYENVFVGLYPRLSDREGKSDRYKIEVFRKSSIYNSCKNNGFAPCQDLSIIPELTKGVKDASVHTTSPSINKIYLGDEDWKKEKKILLNIYQVRCNLFHGHKYVLLVESRNYSLIKESVGVLKSLLWAYLRK